MARKPRIHLWTFWQGVLVALITVGGGILVAWISTGKVQAPQTTPTMTNTVASNPQAADAKAPAATPLAGAEPETRNRQATSRQRAPKRYVEPSQALPAPVQTPTAASGDKYACSNNNTTINETTINICGNVTQ